MRPAARNLLSNYAAYAVSILAGLILTPVIIGAIGKEAFGAWAFILSLTTLLRLLDFGVTPTVIRFTALHRGRSEQTELDSLASTGLAVYLVAGLISVVAGLVLAWFLPDMIDLSPQLEGPAQVAVVLAAWISAHRRLSASSAACSRAHSDSTSSTRAPSSPSSPTRCSSSWFSRSTRVSTCWPRLRCSRPSSGSVSQSSSSGASCPGSGSHLPSSALEAFDRCSATRGSHSSGMPPARSCTRRT